MRAEDQVHAGGGPLELRSSCGRGLRNTGRWIPLDGCHCVAISSRLTKKSLVSVSGRLVKTPCVDLPGIGAEDAQAADEHGHFRRGQL